MPWVWFWIWIITSFLPFGMRLLITSGPKDRSGIMTIILGRTLCSKIWTLKIPLLSTIWCSTLIEDWKYCLKSREKFSGSINWNTGLSTGLPHTLISPKKPSNIIWQKQQNFSGSTSMKFRYAWFTASVMPKSFYKNKQILFVRYLKTRNKLSINWLDTELFYCVILMNLANRSFLNINFQRILINI